MKLRQLIQSAAFGLCGLAVTCPLLADEPLLTNTTSFRIPFSVDDSSQSAGGFAVLFGSRDSGPMQQLQRVPANAGGFRFAAPADGSYQFAVRMADRSGTPNPEDGPLKPELTVIVDTTPPVLQIDLVDAGNGTAQITWKTGDQITPGSLSLEYAEGGDGRWKPLPIAQAVAGRTTIQTRPGTPLAVRGRVTDAAGNAGHVSKQVMLGTTASPPVSAPGQPRSIPGLGTAVGPSPFAAGQQSIPATAVAYGGPLAADTGRAAQAPNYPIVSQPVANPAPNRQMPSGAEATSLIVSGPVFNIAYEVEDVGPSGVSAVELFLTEDNGQQWFRYGEDQDLKSPVLVDVQGEGTFGFAIRVRNGVGFSDPPPQPGETPDIQITVDQTPPSVELATPTVRPGSDAAVLLAWNLTEAEPVDIRLEYATSTTGPWTPLFDWQANRTSYEWPIRHDVPPTVQFRLLARDTAGNVASVQTSQPTVIDLQRPRARMLSVQPANSSGTGY